MTRENKSLLWLFIFMATILILGILSMPIRAENVEELRQQEQEIKPESLMGIRNAECYLKGWTLPKDTWTIFCTVEFFSHYRKPIWIDNIKVYYQKERPDITEAKKVADKWVEFIRQEHTQERIEETTILHYERH